MKKILAAAACAALAACGGGGASGVAPVASGGASNGSLSFTMSVPASSSTAQAIRTRHYTSRDSKGMGVRIAASAPSYAADYSTGGGNAGYTFALSPSHTFTGSGASAGVSETCTAAAASGAFSCTFVLPALSPGYHALQTALFNAAPSAEGYGTGNFSAAGDYLLSISNLPSFPVISGQTNSISFQLGGVVNNAQLQFSGSFVSGTAGSGTLSILATDALGNIIVGSDPFMGLNGSALTLSLNSAASGFTYSGSGSFTTPGSTVTVNYNGAATSSVSFSLQTPSAGTIAGSVQGTGTISVPSSGGTFGAWNINDYPAPTTLTATGNTGATGFAEASNNEVWAVFPSSQTIQQWVNVGSGLTPFSQLQIGSLHTPNAIVYTADARMCFTDTAAADLGCFDPTQPSNPVTYYTTAGTTSDITIGADKRTWFADSAANEIGYIVPGSSTDVAEFADATHAFNTPSAITKDANGNIWVTNTGNCAVQEINPITHAEMLDVATGTCAIYPSQTPILSTPIAIAATSDGNVWVALSNATNIVQITPAGSVNTVALGPDFPPGSPINPTSLTVGWDGNVYVATNYGAVIVVDPSQKIVTKSYLFNSSHDYVGINSGAYSNNIYVGDGSSYSSPFYFSP